MDISKLLDDSRRVTPPSEGSVTAVRSALVAAVADAKAPVRRRPLTNRRRVMLAVSLTVFVAVGAAAGWAAFDTANPRTTFTIECGVDTFIPSESGDPIADCRAALALQETTVPQLAGWVTPTGIVAVLPQGEAPPDGSTPLPAGFRQDRAVLYVNAILGDEVGPLQTGCLSADAAVAYTRRQLETAGLIDWTVSVRDNGPTASGCLSYFVDVEGSSSSVTLISAGAPGSGFDANSAVKLDRMLQSQLSQTPGPECLSTSDAAALAARDARELGIPADEVIVSQAGQIGQGPSCAIAAIDPGGAIQVDIWAVPAATG